MLRDANCGQLRFADVDDRLDLSPSLPVQLLRLNKEVYEEALSILKKVEIRLLSDARYNTLSPKLVKAIRSPTLNILHYPWHRDDLSTRHCEYLLPRLLVDGSPHSLQRLSITMKKADVNRRIDVLSQWTGIFDIVWEGYSEHRVLALFSAACLQKGVIMDDITIEIQEINRDSLRFWDVESLYNYMTVGPYKSAHPVPEHVQRLNRFIWDYAGILRRSNIQITANFCETNKIGKYRGTVRFTRILK